MISGAAVNPQEAYRENAQTYRYGAGNTEALGFEIREAYHTRAGVKEKYGLLKRT